MTNNDEGVSDQVCQRSVANGQEKEQEDNESKKCSFFDRSGPQI